MVKKSTVIFLLTVIGLILIYPKTARAQAVNTAQIHGMVTDPTGAAVPKASIQATHIATGSVRTTVTGTAGDYVLTNLAVGAYTFEVKAAGFERYVQSGIVLQVGDNVALDVALKVGAMTTSVEVSAGATMVQTQDTSISEVIDQRRVDDLPLNGRLPTQLVVLAGAAVNYIPNGGDLTGSKNYLTSVSISVQGGEGNGVDYLLDGADHNDPFSNVNLPLPVPDAMQEFSVQMNGLSARYGVHPGATANFVTKSGTNSFHGDLFEFVRNGDFNARLFGAPTQDTLRRNQFGGTAGGAIKKDKLFYFGAYQGTRLRTAPATTTSHVPTAAAMEGNFSTLDSPPCVSKAFTLKDPFTGGPAFTGNQIPTSLFNSSALSLLKLVPTSTNPCGTLSYGIPTPQDEDQFLGRVDWTISSKQSFYGRYFDTDYRQAPVYSPTSALMLLTTTSYGNWQRAQAMVLGHTWSISPTTINTAHLSWTRLRDNRGGAPNVPNNDDFGVINPDGSPLWQITPHFLNTSITGYFSVGCGTCAPGYFNRNTMQAADDLDFIHGKHQLVFGGEWMRHQLNSPSDFDGNGVYSFNDSVTGDGLADFLLGTPYQFQQSMATAMNWRQDYIGAYAQDDYHVNSRLNVHLGVRWEPFLPETDTYGRGSTFSMSGFYSAQASSVYTESPAGLFFVGDPGIPKGYAYNALDLFAPRVGFAWDMTGSGKQTLRGSYSIFYDLPETFYADRYANAFPWGGNNTLNPKTNGCTATAAGVLVGGCEPGFTSPYGWGATATSSPYPLPFPPPKNFNFGGPKSEGVYINFQLNSKLPSVQEWGLSFERQFPHNWLFSASYLGTHTVHLWAGNEVDPCPPEASACTNSHRRLYTAGITQTINGITVNPGSYYSTIAQQFEGSYASYNALLLSATHRFSQNFSLLSNYTWSHCLSLSDFQGELTGPSFMNPNDDQLDYGNCGMNLNQNFNASIVATMPKFQNVWLNRFAGNWQLSPIITAHSGLWFYAGLGSTDISGTGVGADRPNVVGNPYTYSGNVSTSNATTRYVQILNPGAFDDGSNPPGTITKTSTGTYGDEGRNSLLGPGFFNVDAALIRYFPVKEQMKFELRLEAFNLFNRANPVPPGWSVTAQTNLASPGTPNATSGNWYDTSQAFDMRILQIALKFYF
jgi:hypothetical protein